MMLLRCTWLALAWWLLGPLMCAAGDLAQVDRKIAKEPVYKNKPLYCLVVFGKEFRPRIWLVLDGEILYVDRNGDGDLTEAGKRLELTDRDRAQFPAVEIEAADRVKRKLDLFIYDWRPGQAARPDENGPSLTISDQGNRTYGAWGDHESRDLEFAPKDRAHPPCRRPPSNGL